MRRRGAALLAAALVCALGTPPAVRATLDEPGFRAVAVALARNPISAIAVAPDGRLFAAVQALEQTSGDVPGTAEIRVYTAYAENDGSVLDEGTVWATVETVRATNNEEGLLGMALAPDFATSKLVYVYLTTTDEEVNQHVRVYRENAAGTGEYLGTVKRTLEPPDESSQRNGGPLGFGVDGCLYLGVGDNGGGSRWNAQLLTGTNPLTGGENAQFCTDVCQGPKQYPARTIDDADGRQNHAGKILRMAVEGASPAQPGPGAVPFGAQPFAFGTGLRNPGALHAHPLTGQLWFADRGDSQESEIGIAPRAGNHGWPCLEGTRINTGAASCLGGSTVDAVYAQHPDWQRPVLTHANGASPPTAVGSYTGLGYPAEFYGDVFYLLRDSARIYRVDLEPPCFLPASTGLEPLVFHDSNSDGDFRAVYDIDDDGDFDNPSFTNLTAIAQGPSPFGAAVLYVAGKQNNGNDFTADSAIFRIEYATAFTPYAGPAGRVADACFAGLENPFARTACLAPGGPCPGQADGTPCDDGDVCNGTETCRGGICQAASTPAADGTSCSSPTQCRSDGVCQSGRCAAGPPLPNGTPCPDADPCNGLETCVDAVCQPGAGPAPLGGVQLSVKAKGQVTLAGSFAPAPAIAPSTTDAVTLELMAGADAVHRSELAHPASDPRWRVKKGGFRYKDGRGNAGGLTLLQLKPKGTGMVLKAKARGSAVTGATGVSAKLIVGDQCFVSALGCATKGRTLRCAP
ncbi:MAG: PQQ-dependent sugar dehydrogenase [bacterium]|nr:PQQ-dependent sugar dehydrogenase [bacterium]